MKKITLITSLGLIAFIRASNGQGAFQNLNFEQANPVSAGDPGNPFAVTAASAFPDWTVYAGNGQLTEINFNDPDAGTTTVGLVNQSSPFFPGIDDYSALLQGGGTASAASISQTGVIPLGTESLLFEAQSINPYSLVDLFVGGQSVSFSAVGTGANYTLYAANVSGWAGDTESLTFSVPEYGGNWVIDDISFSAVPEPSPIVLSGIGGLLFAMYRRFAPKRMD